MTLRNLLATSISVFLLAGCGSLLTSDEVPDQTWTLSPPGQQFGEIVTGKESDLAVQVRVAPGLDTKHLLIAGPGPKTSHLSGAQWPEYLPEYLDSLVKRSLQKAGLFRRVTGKSGAAAGACQLELEFQQFWIFKFIESSPGKAILELNASFDCGPVSDQYWSFGGVDVRGNTVSGVVMAHQEVLDNETLGLIGWLAHHLQDQEKED